MPQRSHGCRGRIVDVPQGSTIEASGARAQLVAPPGAAESGIVTLAWSLDDDECTSQDNLALPFLASGSPEALAQIEPLLAEALW
jgi:hypothetical protein